MPAQNWALVLVAIIAAMIAYLQWVTAHQRVVLDLFDRRKRAFEGLEIAVQPVFNDGAVSQNAFHALLVAKGNCRFLFGADVNDYVQKMQEDFAYLMSFTEAVINQRAEEERARLFDNRYERLQRVVDFHRTAVPLFEPYMRIDLKMRNFPFRLL